jgi:hypothetical protein
MLSRATIRCLALDHAAATIYAALRERGIDSVLLKGPGLGSRLRAAHHRLYNDVDLLVAPNTFDAAQQLFYELGFRPAMPGARADDWSLWHERPWMIPGPVALTVDLHRGFAGAADPEAFWTAVFSRAEHIGLAGGSIAIPDETCTALLVALHAASPGRSAKPRRDLDRAISIFESDVWPAAATVAERCGAVSAFALGLRQVGRGVRIAAVLGLPEHATASQLLVARRGSPTAHALARIAELPTPRARLRHVVLRLFPSAAAMRSTQALARRGPIGLVLAYLVRIGQHAANTPRAVREWRAARAA